MQPTCQRVTELPLLLEKTVIEGEVKRVRKEQDVGALVPSDGKDLSWEGTSKEDMKDGMQLAGPGVWAGVTQAEGMTGAKARRLWAWGNSSGNWESETEQPSVWDVF